MLSWSWIKWRNCWMPVTRRNRLEKDWESPSKMSAIELASSAPNIQNFYKQYKQILQTVQTLQTKVFVKIQALYKQNSILQTVQTVQTNRIFVQMVLFVRISYKQYKQILQTVMKMFVQVVFLLWSPANRNENLVEKRTRKTASTSDFYKHFTNKIDFYKNFYKQYKHFTKIQTRTNALILLLILILIYSAVGAYAPIHLRLPAMKRSEKRASTIFIWFF